MTELNEMYQQVILDHAKRPRNFRELGGATHQATGHNPLCGDRVTVYLNVDGDGRVTESAFTGSGCAICTASASIMTQHVTGTTMDEARDAAARFRGLVMAEDDDGEAADDEDKLAVFSGVKKFPMRVKCATLPWHTMTAALEQKDESVSTE